MCADDLVVFGGGHAATILARAAKKGLVQPRAFAAVAPTWAGPLPIVFGRDSNMETRYIVFAIWTGNLELRIFCSAVPELSA